MKKYHSDNKNNVCIDDENGVEVVLMKCCDNEECKYYCDQFNKAEENERKKSGH